MFELADIVMHVQVFPVSILKQKGFMRDDAIRTFSAIKTSQSPVQMRRSYILMS